MGSVSSKAARRFPKEKPSWAGSRTPSVAEPERLRSEKESLAFESKHEAIERDAKDSHWVEKLHQLGPVRVDGMQTATRAAKFADVQHMHRSRMRSEKEAAAAAATTTSASTSLVNDRLLASTLSELLEARKSITKSTELETLAKRYRIDVGILERLGRIVNTPSVDESTVRRTTDKHGEESLTMMACWVDPPYARAHTSNN